MVFRELPLKGAYLIDIEKHTDSRGFFGRTYCKREFSEIGIDFPILQSNISFSQHLHTLRGMHFQPGEFAEKKLVKCISGRIMDVIIDLREESNTYAQHYKIELSPDKEQMLFVPEGFAHGFITLSPNTYVFYQVSNYYNSLHERAIRWNDPFFGIDWPTSSPVMSEKDANHPDYKYH